jgi:hypothetical protein
MPKSLQSTPVKIRGETDESHSECKFETYAVVYFDVLGFRSLIYRAEQTQKEDDDSRTKLCRLIHEIEDHVELDNLEITKDVPQAMRPRYFFASDSIVIAAPIECQGFSGLVVTGLKAIQVAQKLFELGFVVRGAIAVGPLLLRDFNIFGSAFMEAFSLGEKRAIYPRIILSDAALKHHKMATHKSVPISELGLWIRFEGDIVLDTLNQSLLQGFRIHGGIENSFAAFRGVITKQLEQAVVCSSVYQKWAWMARFYNAARTRQGLDTVSLVDIPSNPLLRYRCAVSNLVGGIRRCFRGESIAP